MLTILSLYFFIHCVTLIIIYFVWKFILHLYEVVMANYGIHVVHKPRKMKLNTTFINPFCFEVDLKNASWSGVKCTLSCDDSNHCYVQAMWCVPMYELVEQLNKGWTTTSNIHALYRDASLVLLNNSKQTIEFKPPSDFLDSHGLRSFQGMDNSHMVYPFVLLMSLFQNDPQKYPSAHVELCLILSNFEQMTSNNHELLTDQNVIQITSAHALHLPDMSISQPFIIAQYLALSSGRIGQVKKIFRPSADEANDSCLICCQQSTGIVQLSCCHLCVCCNCYGKHDKCPVCRYTHLDFFDLPDRVASFSE